MVWNNRMRGNLDSNHVSIIDRDGNLKYIANRSRNGGVYNANPDYFGGGGMWRQPFGYNMMGMFGNPLSALMMGGGIALGTQLVNRVWDMFSNGGQESRATQMNQSMLGRWMDNGSYSRQDLAYAGNMRRGAFSSCGCC
jgi:hypothetical protein